MIDTLFAYFGLVRMKKYIKAIEVCDQQREYINALERAVQGMQDPKKPILIMGSDATLMDVLLEHGQQIIVSPFAKHVWIQNVNAINYSGVKK